MQDTALRSFSPAPLFGLGTIRQAAEAPAGMEIATRVTLASSSATQVRRVAPSRLGGPVLVETRWRGTDAVFAMTRTFAQRFTTWSQRYNRR
jgi:hypothetical protein